MTTNNVAASTISLRCRVATNATSCDSVCETQSDTDEFEYEDADWDEWRPRFNCDIASDMTVIRKAPKIVR